MPTAFRSFLHPKVAPGVLAAGNLILNELVKDLLVGVSTLHANGIMHCDLKPKNVLVTFNRGGKRKDFHENNFGAARLVVADFGVSRVFSTTPSADATIQTSSLALAKSIVGTQSFMSPAMLKIFQDSCDVISKPDDLAPVIAALPKEFYLANDAFACGCTLAYLCSDGIHPFSSKVHSSIPNNIIAYRRLPLRKLNVSNPTHLIVVDRLTAKGQDKRWTVRQALEHLGGSDLRDDSDSVLKEVLELHTRPDGSCEDQLLCPELMELLPNLQSMVLGDETSITNTTNRLVSKPSLLPMELDADS